MTEEVWMIEAIVQPFKFDAVMLALQDIPEFRGVTVSDCRGFGQEKLAGAREGEAEAHGHRRKNEADFMDFSTKVKLEVAVVGREGADKIIEAIVRAAHTGRRGDGKVFAWPLSQVVRVRTSEDGEAAL